MKKYCLLIIGFLGLGMGDGSAQMTNLVNFNHANGGNPSNNLALSGNVLYGFTSWGTNGFGNIFSVQTDGGGFNNLYNFYDTIGSPPQGSLTFFGNKIFGVTSNGGPYHEGMIFSIDTDGSGFTVLYNFWLNGGFPVGTMVLSGNTLYGMGQTGTLYNYGCVFSIHTDGSNYRDIFDFNDTDGAYPYGSLKLVGNTLYGMTQNGGVNDSGCVFSIDTNGGNYKDILDFNGSNGSIPLGEVAISGNVLYGMTSRGGTYYLGTAFSVHTDGTGYRKLINFDSLNGAYPNGSFTLSHKDLFGLAEEGGANGYGVMFAIDTDGSGYNKLFDFNSTNGGYPLGSLTYSGNALYGTAYVGGTVPPWSGVVFKYSSPCVFINPASTNYYCAMDKGTAKVLVSGGVPPYTYSWSPGGQTTDSIYGLSAGIYSVTVTDSTGCSQSISVTVLSTPPLVTVIASPDTLPLWDTAHLTVSCNEPSATFIWSTGATTQSIDVTPSVTTTYTVIANTLCGPDTVTKTIVVAGCANLYVQDICIVTVDSATGHNEIIWGRTNSPSSGSYNVYKLDSSYNYTLINSQPLTAYSDYLDITSYPESAPYTYALATVDTCGVSALSAPHTTIWLWDTNEGTTNLLRWTAYVGFTPSMYRILRGTAMNNLIQIDSLPSGFRSYTDTLGTPYSIYRVDAVNPSGPCIPTTRIKPHSTSTVETNVSSSNSKSVVPSSISNLNNSISNLNIYPNPSNGQITIQWSVNSGQSSVRISIYDELGQAVYDNTETQTVGKNIKQLNLGNLAAGVYTLRMQTSGGTMVRKIELMKK